MVFTPLVASLLFFLPSSTRSQGSTIPGVFQRIATLDVTGGVAEIVDATPDGLTLIYTNADDNRIGFVDISNPEKPKETGFLDTGGSPTSVAITPDGKWGLVTVDTASPALLVVDLGDRSLERSIALGGQPDSVNVSRDGNYAAVAIENQRNESLNSGRMPQLPAGLLTIVDLKGSPATWTTRDVALTGLAGRFPEDPEPEFMDINAANQVAITLQENNHIVIVNLSDGKIVNHFTAGTTTHPADILNDGNVDFTGQITNATREPDSILWTPGGRLLTANEGDYSVDVPRGTNYGGRGFTIFNTDGTVAFESGEAVELEAVKTGHYPDTRSTSKGTELEGAELAVFAGIPFAFIASERGDFVAVYDLRNETQPKFFQLLPTNDSPEGVLAIPRRNLLVTANEGDGSLTIFRFGAGLNPGYPDVISNGIWWSALSGLDLSPDGKVFAVPDSVIRPSRIFTLTNSDPMKVESVLTLAKNYDLEGIAIRPGGGWWVVSEGAGNIGQATLTKNLLISINADGTIAQEVELPAELNAKQQQFGFEGVATSLDGSRVYVALQREWLDDPKGLVKIGVYTTATGDWRFFHYPIDPAPSSSAWVGLSEIHRLNDTTFAVIERDNQARENARVKRIYSFSIAGVTPGSVGGVLPVLKKTLVRDLLVQDGFLLEKAEGMFVNPFGDILVMNDNDGAGETSVFRILNQGYDLCMQDENSGDVLRVNSLTGDYLFIRCAGGGQTLAGRGRISRQGCTLRLNSATVEAEIDGCSYDIQRGKASVKRSLVGPAFAINDQNLDDNTCDCR